MRKSYMTDVQNIEQLDKEEQINKDAQKLIKEIEESVKNEDPFIRGLRLLVLFNKDDIYH